MMIEVPYGFTREELIACVEREIRLREVNYPRWVEKGTMRASTALDEVARMKAVLQVIEQLPASQLALTFGSPAPATGAR